MIFTILFFGAIVTIAAWWLWRQGLTAKPWLETGVVGDVPGGRAAMAHPAKIGLGVFLAVVGALFALLVSAYSMRMEMVDWRPLPTPQLLWANTGVLVLSSVALQWAAVAARRRDAEEIKAGLLAGGLGALLFLAGQILAWRQLAAAGYLPATNPANTFFYLLTALHGLHLLGGLVALGRTGLRLRRGIAAPKLRLSVELCATYWHFLLAVWIVLFALLAYSPAIIWLYALCTASFG